MTTRNEKIAEWAVANPCSSLQEIGDYYGITRERVRQILAERGIRKMNAATANKAPGRLCSDCGKGVSTSKTVTCMECRMRPVIMICSLCSESFGRSRNQAFRYASRLRGRYTIGFVICPPCEPKRRAALGRALGRLPAGKNGRREPNPKLFKRLYMQELERV